MEVQKNATKLIKTTTNFSMLPLEIKVKIFNMLNVSSRYNASLVWEEMGDEIWRSFPTERGWTRKFEETDVKLKLLHSVFLFQKFPS